jgi:GNAT superfamily N-acetyltransferase
VTGVGILDCMSAEQLVAVREFYAAFARRQAAQVREVVGGVVVLHPRYWASHEHNQLLIDGTPPSAGELTATAEAALGHLGHRRITVLSDAAGAALAPDLVAAGYRHEPELVMVHDGVTEPVAPPEVAVAEVAPGELRAAVMRQFRTWMPRAAPVEIEHLADRREARLRGAVDVRFLAVRDSRGDVAAWADVYRDPDRSVAQIEDVITADTHLRRGYGDAVLAAAHRLAAGCRTFFLLADPDAWPRTWYARRGFVPVSRVHVFTRLTADAPRA